MTELATHPAAPLDSIATGIRAKLREVVASIGREMLEVKAGMTEDQFGKWLVEEFEWGRGPFGIESWMQAAEATGEPEKPIYTILPGTVVFCGDRADSSPPKRQW